MAAYVRWLQTAMTNCSTWRPPWHWRLLCYIFFTGITGRPCAHWRDSGESAALCTYCDMAHIHWMSAIIAWCSRLQRMQRHSWSTAASAMDELRQFGAWYCSRRWLQMCSYCWLILFTTHWRIYSGWISFCISACDFNDCECFLFNGQWQWSVNIGLSKSKLGLHSELWFTVAAEFYFYGAQNDLLQSIMESWIAWSSQCQPGIVLKTWSVVHKLDEDIWWLQMSRLQYCLGSTMALWLH